MKINNRNNAFTLAEVLLTLAILGTLVAITTPILKSALPNFDTYRAKKANLTLKDTINNMINYDAQYEGKHDFSNTGQSVVGVDYVRNVKTFREIFLKHIDTIETLKCHAYGVYGGDIDCYRTTDGIVWAIPDTDFVSKDNGSVVIDMGSNEGYATNYYVPITIYPNFSKGKYNMINDGEKYMIDNAIVYGVRRDGKIIFIEDNNIFNCESFPNIMQCVAIREITSSKMKRR